MEIADLNNFLFIARHENLQVVANELNTTPSALSKSLKRLENSLGLLLFDRVGKSLRLNDHGKKLQPQAAKMLTLVENTRHQLCRNAGPISCKIVAPAILQYRWASVIARLLSEEPNTTLSFETAFEQAALDKLKQGEAHMALVTDAILANLPSEIDYIELGKLQMQVAAGRTHPLVADVTHNAVKVAATDIQQHAFATPHISPFCGESRGLGCDGWQDQHLPRKTQWIVNDYAVLSQLVKSGQAIAYLPDFLLREWALVRLDVNGYPYQYNERVLLLFHKNGPDWVRSILNQI